MKAKGFFITGTDTGVGKTVVTACLLSLFQKQGCDVGVMKPIETGVDPECSSIANSDALFLMEVAGNGDVLSEVSPVRLKTAASPFQAARMEGCSIDLSIIKKSYRLLADKRQLLLVEGIGGLMVPIKSDYMVADLILEFSLPVILVSRLSLGTLNHTLLTLKEAKQRGIQVAGVIFNNPDGRETGEVEQGQAALITELSGVPVIGQCPFIDPLLPESFTADLGAVLEKMMDLNLLKM